MHTWGTALSETERASIIEWVKSDAVPPNVVIITSGGIVVWLGPVVYMPEIMPWPDPLTVNVNTVQFERIKALAAAREKGIPRG